MALRVDTSATDLAAAAANLVEGARLNQCLADRDPLDPPGPSPPRTPPPAARRPVARGH